MLLLNDHAHIHVHVAPSITSFSVSPSRFLMEGATTTLSCQFRPTDAIIVWRLNDTQISDVNSINTIPGESNLTISSFMQASSGSYECVVSNGVGGVVSDAIVLVPDPDEMDVPGTVLVYIHVHVCLHMHVYVHAYTEWRSGGCFGMFDCHS